jgi:hypothetical protein
MMPQVMILTQRVVKIPHAGREVPCGEFIDLLRPYQFTVLIREGGSRRRGNAIEKRSFKVLQ